MANNTGAQSSQPARSGGLSLYANLLEPQGTSGSATISSAPVIYKQDEAQHDEAARKQHISSALRFQPTKRPQLQQKKKPAFPKAPGIPAASSSPDLSKPAPPITQPVVKTTLADWQGDDDDVNGFYGADKPSRGGRKAKKRKKNKQHEDKVVQATNWDDIYDPSKPTNYEEWMQSDERIEAEREWKDLLYAHRIARNASRPVDDKSEDEAPAVRRNPLFAPPPALSFAPPSNYDAATAPRDRSGSPPYTRPADAPHEASGEDAYARRMRLSGTQPAPPPPPPSENVAQLHAESGTVPPQDLGPPPPNQTTSANTSSFISAAPVLYDTVPPPPTTEAEASGSPREEVAEEEGRRKTPGKAGFAERMMSKMGWEKGQGLGATGSGILKPLQVKTEKKKNKQAGNEENGPPRKQQPIGRIIGGKRAGDDEEEGKFGRPSEVVVIFGMLDDLTNEQIEGRTFYQEVGEFVQKFGNVNRFVVDEDSEKFPVYVEYTASLSALRAVNSLDGMKYRDSTLMARFFDPEKFAKREFS